jgi:uncharacterized protein YjbI with pentapeptide repeats
MTISNPSIARKRTAQPGNGTQSSVWLEVGSNVVLHTEHSTTIPPAGGHGSSHWRRCHASDCLGSVIGHENRCLLHASSKEKDLHIREVVGGYKALDLRGIEMEAEQFFGFIGQIADGDSVIPYTVICAGAVFTTMLVLKNLKFTQSLDFHGATFERQLRAVECAFADLDIRYAGFVREGAYFKDCTTERLFADHYVTEQSVAFEFCTFNGSVAAKGAGRDLRLIGCRAYKDCSITSAKLKFLGLNESRFDGDLDLQHTEAERLDAKGMELSESSTLGPIEVSSLADFSNTHFKRSAHLIITTPALNLSRASFEGGGRVECKHAKINMSRLSAHAPLLIAGSEDTAILTIQDADCGNLRLSSVDLRACSFYGCHDLQAITLESTVSLPSVPKPLRSRRKCIVDEIVWRKTNTRWRKTDWVSADSETERGDLGISAIDANMLTAGEIARVYRSLRVSVEGQSNQPGATDFYYGEMEMRRLDGSASRSDRFIIWFYWLLSGYGLRALRSYFYLLCVFLAGSMLMRTVGLRGSHHSWATAFIACGQSVIPGLDVSANLTGNGEAIQIALRIIGPVLFGLGLLALRNRVKR